MSLPIKTSLGVPVSLRPLLSAALPYIALILAVIFWGFSFIASKIALQGLTPFCLLFSRFSMASIFFGCLLFRPGAPRLSKSTVKSLFVLSLFQPGLYFFFETYGLKYTSATKTSLIIATVPIVVLLMSAALLREKLRAINIAGIICSIAGVALLVFGQAGTSGQTSSLSGDLLIVGAVFAAAIYMIFTRHLGKTITSVQITGLQMIFGCLLFFPFFLWDLPSLDWHLVNIEIVSAVVCLTLFATIAAFSCYNFALSRIAAAKAAVFINAIPMVTALGAWLVLGETLSGLQFVGAIIVIGSVCLANMKPAASS